MAVPCALYEVTLILEEPDSVLGLGAQQLIGGGEHLTPREIGSSDPARRGLQY